MEVKHGFGFWFYNILTMGFGQVLRFYEPGFCFVSKTPQNRHCDKMVCFLFNLTNLYMVILIDVLVENYIMAECLNYMKLKYIYSRPTMC